MAKKRGTSFMDIPLDEIGFLYGRQAIGKGFEKGKVQSQYYRAASKKEPSTIHLFDVTSESSDRFHIDSK